LSAKIIKNYQIRFFSDYAIFQEVDNCIIFGFPRPTGYPYLIYKASWTYDGIAIIPFGHDRWFPETYANFSSPYRISGRTGDFVISIFFFYYDLTNVEQTPIR